VTRDGSAYVRYLLDWCEASETRRALLSMSIGDWSEEASVADRSIVAVEMGAEGWRLTDAAERDDLEGWGPFVADADVRARGAVDQVRELARLVMSEDPTAASVNRWTVGDVDSALPQSSNSA